MTTAKPMTVKFVELTGCSGQCTYSMPVNNGLELPCQEWSNEESAALREHMLRDNQLMASGFVRMVERSSLGNSKRIKKTGIDVGRVRTQDSGSPELNSCDVVFNTVRFTDFTKEFYVVSTSLNTKMCTRQFIGKKQQDLIGDQLSSFDIAEEFANTDLASIIIAGIIDEFQSFLPEFMLLASSGGSGRNLHGDDGILAKSYYAEKYNVKFHTISFDLSSLSDFPNVYINAIVGGARYEKDPNSSVSAEAYALDFTTWLNGLKEKRESMFDATYDSANETLIVASKFSTRFVDLKIVLNDGSSIVDWGCVSSAEANMLPYTQLQDRSLIDDVPTNFKYEHIDSTNFFEKFKYYKKEFTRSMHRKGYPSTTMSEVLIGIDPELMLERQDYLQTQLLAGNNNADSMESVAFDFGRFVPLNALNNTGLFFMTTRGNILQLSDGNNYENTLERIRIRESKCEGKVGEIEILSSAPPIGSEVEVWAKFASNITDSWFVNDNNLANRPPYKWTMKNIECYDDNTKNDCASGGCEIYTDVSILTEYNSGADETTISVSVSATLNSIGTLTYDLNWALSDGTSGNSTNANFVITLPGDQTNEGYRISINGSVDGTVTETSGTCTDYVAYVEEIGESNGFSACDYIVEYDMTGTPMTDQIEVELEVNENGESVLFVDQGLSLNIPTDFPAIEAELEAIFPGSIATVTLSDIGILTIEITNVPSYYGALEVISAGSGTTAGILNRTC